MHQIATPQALRGNRWCPPLAADWIFDLP